MLHAGDYLASADRCAVREMVSVQVDCTGAAPRSGVGPEALRRAAGALRALLAAVGLRLESRCQLVESDEAVEGTPALKVKFPAAWPGLARDT